MNDITALLNILGYVCVNYRIVPGLRLVYFHLEKEAHEFQCPLCGEILTSYYDRRDDRILLHTRCFQWYVKLVVPVYRIFCPKCNRVLTEKISFQHEGMHVTSSLAKWVHEFGKLLPIQAISWIFRLGWDMIKRIDKKELEKKQANHLDRDLGVIGVDEIAFGKGHNYHHLVTDLREGEVIWMSKGRKTEDLGRFFNRIGEKINMIKAVCIDMWRGFIKSIRQWCPHAEIIFDKFHVIRHLQDAIDKLRRSEYSRLKGDDRRYIKGKKYLLLSRKANLDRKGRRALKDLFKVNRRLEKAYILKELFGNLWTYKTVGWAKRFFESWKDMLKWSRLKTFKDFAKLMDRHAYGIYSYFKYPVNFGLVESMNLKAKNVIRRHRGFRDERYQELKVIQACSKLGVFQAHQLC